MTETRYEHDENGQLVRAVTFTEPEWDDEQAGWMVALAEHEDGLCPRCGQPLDEAMDPESEGLWDVDGPFEDHACRALAVYQQRAGEGHKHPEALRYTVRRRRAR